MEIEEDEKTVTKKAEISTKPGEGGWSVNNAWLNDANGAIYKRVTGFYKDNHSKQTVAHVINMKKKYKKLNRAALTIWQILSLLENVIDESDPDLAIPQIYHCYQTAEALRHRYADEKYDWLHLVGLIHDCGKMLLLFGEPQWTIGGDTYPVGCAFHHPAVMEYPAFFEGNNPDGKDKRYQSDLGIYSEHCGFDAVHMSFGHDEYFYHVLKENQTKLPEEALYIVRYHSFWASHFGGEYKYLMNERDERMLPYLQQFRNCDLYSKDEKFSIDIGAIKPYYERLAKKYLPFRMFF